MENKLYNIEIKKNSCRKATFDYPCETVDSEILQNRNIYIIGDREKYSKLISMFGEYANIENSVTNATDIIIFPNAERFEDSSIEGYYNELAYYHNVCCEFLAPFYENLYKMIVLLPPHSTEYSSHYTQIADYATSWYINGLAKCGARTGHYVYGIELAENTDEKSLYDIILYLLSSNSNHLACDIIKLDR